MNDDDLKYLRAVGVLLRRGYVISDSTGGIERAADEIERLREALRGAVATITDYIEYEHDGDPWTEDARAMGEMDIDDYATDGRLAAAREALKGSDQ